MSILRTSFLEKIKIEFQIHSVCAILGPRQCGKTTLVKQFAQEQTQKVHFFDCENPFHLAQLENPMITLGQLKGLIVIDEVQMRPDLFSVLRVLVDDNLDRRFLITGSASRDLIHQSSETLAGRIGYVQMTPFSLDEVPNFKKLWHRGGYPKSYLAETDELSARWLDAYIQTFLERDLNAFGFNITPRLMGKLWRMLAHMHGQVLNVHTLAQSLDADQRTIKRYLSILEGAFMITLLRPWHTNLGKREVKSPKIYIRDSGLLFRLLNLNASQISFSPQLGASFEGFVIEALTRHFEAYNQDYFWSIHSGAELDYFLEYKGQKLGFEIKYTESPSFTSSMRSALETLNLDHLYVVTPMIDVQPFPLADKVTVMGIKDIISIPIIFF